MSIDIYAHSHQNENSKRGRDFGDWEEDQRRKEGEEIREEESKLFKVGDTCTNSSK